MFSIEEADKGQREEVVRGAPLASGSGPDGRFSLWWGLLLAGDTRGLNILLPVEWEVQPSLSVLQTVNVAFKRSFLWELHP